MHLWLGFYPQLATGLFHAPCALRQLIQFLKPEEVTGNVGKPRKWMWKSQERKTYLLHVTGFLSSISWGPLSCSICLYIHNPSKLVAILANQENVPGNPSKRKLIHCILCKSSWHKWNPWYFFSLYVILKDKLKATSYLLAVSAYSATCDWNCKLGVAAP